MARVLKLTVKGLAEVNARLKEMEDSVSAASMKGLLLTCASLIKQRSIEILRSHTQRSIKNRPGWAHLEDAITAQSGKSETYMKAWAKTVHKLAPQGIWLEFGHRIVGHKQYFSKAGGGFTARNSDTGKRTTARPFFRPAVDQTRSQVRTMIKDGIKRMLMGGTQAKPAIEPEETGWVG